MIEQSQQSGDFTATSSRELSQATARTLSSALSLCFVCVLPLTVGCQLGAQQQEVRHADPVLPMTMSRAELVDYLNGQNHGLNGWRCMSTRMHVRLPGIPPQRLSGYIACQSPQYFRLTADNLIAKADLGSNASHCWVYVKPGESAVMMWKHEDTGLLQQIPSGIPYIDPNWLMLVLGITPLDANDYELSRSPNGKPELWLTTIEQSPSGRPLRRIIKVDTIQGVIREHGVYDSEANALVRAQLSRHQRRDGILIPSCVKLLFPQMDAELALTFDGIETNPHLPDHLWHMPDKNVRVVDLGRVVRHKLIAQRRPPQHPSGQSATPRVTLQPPVFHEPDRSVLGSDSERATDGWPSSPADIDEPDWDTPISFSKSPGPAVSFEEEVPKPVKRAGFFSRLFGRG